MLTTDIRGQRFVETILGIRACERAGIPTVLLTQEEDNEDGTAPPLLMSAPEVVSVVSTGTGGQEEPFPAVDRVIGAFDDGSGWEKQQPPIHGPVRSGLLQRPVRIREPGSHRLLIFWVH